MRTLQEAVVSGVDQATKEDYTKDAIETCVFESEQNNKKKNNDSL